MVAKARTNVNKLCAVFCCARQTVNAMLSDEPDRFTNYLDYIVTGQDVAAAWSLVEYSIYQYTQFKVSEKIFLWGV